MVWDMHIKIIFHFFLPFAQSSVDFIPIEHSNLNAKFSLEILDPYLESMKFIAEKADSYIHIVPNVPKVFNNLIDYRFLNFNEN